uniref:vitamin-K-epoxide reductase (warfarin-sensitive) n=1 Tax=Phallusia mammillata TaxID=59560 RepID=A0A6F9DXM1_9ASCI|nr:vitamin K epoxide reductase [Phallusia mammillata]
MTLFQNFLHNNISLIMALTAIARILFCAVGIGLSIYAFFVETTKEHDIHYKALCDLSESVSCSAVFTSEYGRGFGIVQHIFGKDHFLNMPNSIFGITFFIVQLAGLNHSNKFLLDVLFWMTAMGIVMCFYLAYILAFILHDFCVICVSTYGMSFGLHYLNYAARKAYDLQSKKRK